jgi:hypothetical protein
MDTQQMLERRPAAARTPGDDPQVFPGAGAALDAARAAHDEARDRREKVAQLLGKLRIEDARNSGGQ